MYFQLISLTLVATVLAHGPGGFGGPGGPVGAFKEPQSCVDERNAHKECITSSLGFTFEPAAVHACFETCTPTASVASAPARAQPNRRSSRGARGGHQPQLFQLGSQNGVNITAMKEQMKATHECIKAAMEAPMDTCLKENGVTFTLVAPPEPAITASTMAAPPPPPPPPKGGPGGFMGGKHGPPNPVQGLLMMEQRAAACGTTVADCVKKAMNGNTATELSALLCTADTACPKPASDSQCKQDRDVLKKASCICQQSLAADFELAAANCAASSGVSTPSPAKQRGGMNNNMKQRNCSAEHSESHSAESAESAEEKQSPFCQAPSTANAFAARSPARFEQQGNNTDVFTMMFNGTRPQFQGGAQGGRPSFGSDGGRRRPQPGQGNGQQGGRRPPPFAQQGGDQQGAQRPAGGNGGSQTGDETASTEAPLVKRRSF